MMCVTYSHGMHFSASSMHRVSLPTSKHQKQTSFEVLIALCSGYDITNSHHHQSSSNIADVIDKMSFDLVVSHDMKPNSGIIVGLSNIKLNLIEMITDLKSSDIHVRSINVSQIYMPLTYHRYSRIAAKALVFILGKKDVYIHLH